MKRIFGLTALTFLSMTAVFADIPVPERPKQTPTATPVIEKEAEMQIRISSDPPPLPLDKNLFKNMQVTPFTKAQGTVRVRLSDDDDPEIRLIIPGKNELPVGKGE